MKTQTFEVSSVRRAAEPLEEIPYHQAIKYLLGQPLVDPTQTLKKEIDLLVSYEMSDRVYEPCRIDELLAESKQKLAIATAKEAKADELMKEPILEKIKDLFIPNFSTTSATERTVAEITLLDAVESYFEYRFYSLRGIPEITLEGTVADWQTLADRVEAFAQFDLEWWLIPLRPIMRELVASAGGYVRKTFWKSMYKFESESGGDVITGWITAFFPYFWDGQGNPTVKNKWLVNGGKKLRSLLNAQRYGPKVCKFPSSLSRVPFKWIYREQKFDMELLGGFVGVTQDKATLALRPEIGWAIRQVNPALDEQVKSRWKKLRWGQA